MTDSRPHLFQIWLDASDGSIATYDGVQWPDGTADVHHRYRQEPGVQWTPEALARQIHGKQARIEWDPEFPLPIRPDGTHHYVSTYCVHGDHAACRRTCKTCASSCLCPCGHPKPEPYCGYDYHDMSEAERCGIACMCQPHAVGEACNCPEGCPTHNHGGPDVVEGSIGGRATDPELTDDDRCPVCGCVVGPDCEACERDCQTPAPAPVAGVATSEEQR